MHSKFKLVGNPLAELWRGGVGGGGGSDIMKTSLIV